MLLGDDKEYLKERKETEKTREIKNGRQGQASVEEESESGSGSVIATEAPNVWKTAATAIMTPKDDIEYTSNTYGISEVPVKKNSSTESMKASEEDSYHQVWRPKKRPQLSYLATRLTIREQQKKSIRDHTTKPPPKLSKVALVLRQQQLLDRVQATQTVLKETTDELSGAKKSSISFREASKLIISDQRKKKEHYSGYSSLSDVVTQYLTAERGKYAGSSPGPQVPMSRQYSAYKGRTAESVLGAISLDKWYKLVEERRAALGDDVDKMNT